MRVGARAWLLLVVFAALHLSCAGAVGEALAPDPHTAGEALGEREVCRTVAAYAEPLIVDWKAQQRLDLELAMRSGVAVVAYDCDRFELLKGCQVAGSYRFAGVSRKEDVVQLENRDEVEANLPLQGATLGAGLERGSTIDLALVLIGKKATTVRRAARVELEGDCAGATHFVRAATIGAFAMDRGTLGKARAALELFGAGISGKSDAERREQNKDGQIGACQKAASTDDVPPDQCQAALRLELVPVSDEPRAVSEPEGPPEPTAQKNPCPEGLVLAGSKCARPAGAESYLCRDNDLADCRKQCDANDAGSCFNLGLLLSSDAANQDFPRADTALRKACQLAHGPACHKAAWVTCARSRDQTCVRMEARPLNERGCELGDASSCLQLTMSSERIGLTGEQAVRFGERACDLGSALGCSVVGLVYLGGEMDVKKDTERGISVLNRSCEGEGTMSCLMLARVFEEGKYLPPDAKRQAAALQVACLRGSVVACARLGHLYASGDKDVTRDETKAARFWRLGCPADGPADASACAALGRQLWRQRGPNDEVLALLVRACEWNEGCADAATVARELVWKKLYGQCHSGDGEACGKLAPWLLRKGCDALDEPSCSRFATHYPELAKPWFAERCIGSLIQGHHVWCKQHVRLGGTMPASPPAKPAR